jgi:hypothetical protein
MTLQEILKAQGLNDEQVKKVADEMKSNKIFTAGEENLDIRYKDLQEKHRGKEKEHQEAVALIEQLKKDNAGNEALQGKITQYESTVAELQAQLEAAKIDSALKVALLEAKVQDVDYLTFKIKEKGEIKLDDNGKIKGIDDTLAALKVQFPNQFETAQSLQVNPQRLPANDGNISTGITAEQFGRMGYQSRLKLKQEQPEIYAQMTGKTE